MSQLKVYNGTAWVPAVVGAKGDAGAPGVTPIFTMQDTLAVRTGVSRFYFESTRTLVSARASVNTAPTGSAVVVLIKINGTAVGTISIAAGTNTATTTINQAVNLNDYATVDVTSVGSTTAGSDLTVTLNIN
jgi:hypothetical protein